MSTELHSFASRSRSKVETPLWRLCILLAWSIQVYSDPFLACCKSRSPNPPRSGWVLKPGLVNNRTKREWAFWGSPALQYPSVEHRGEEICLIIIKCTDGWKTNAKKTYYCVIVMFGLDNRCPHIHLRGMMGKTSSERILYIFLCRETEAI